MMAESQVLSPAEVEAEHREESDSPYLKIWLVLVSLIVVETVFAFFLKDWFVVLLVGLAAWATIQAAAMGWWFMHLKFEGPWAKWLILAAVIMSAIVISALVPDIAFRSSQDQTEDSKTVTAPPTAQRHIVPASRAFV
jgi:caa(3)-type oxidase subunit IV